jgi:hypothetical protein
MKKTIVVFSNPFGYGPTGNAIPVIKSLLEKIKKTEDIEIVFAGSGLCMEIVSDVPVKKVLVNERDVEKVKEYLKTVENPLVISSQNYFCARAAKELGITCAFIDILAWCWKVIPPENFVANEIFWIRFPDIEKRIPEEYKNNIHIVSSIIRRLPAVAVKEKQLMIHIGGAKYPLAEKMPYAYFDLMAKGLNALKADKNFDRVIFTGGSEAVDYIQPKVNNDLVVMIKENFIQELNKSAHVLTVAGVTSTFESFSFNVPTSFLLPLNLSHMALEDILRNHDCAPNRMEWENYVTVHKDLRNMTEREAIAFIDSYAKIIVEDETLTKKYIEDFVRLATTIPDNANQQKLIQYIGDTGGDEIVDILADRWELPKVEA